MKLYFDILSCSYKTGLACSSSHSLTLELGHGRSELQHQASPTAPAQGNSSHILSGQCSMYTACSFLCCMSSVVCKPCTYCKTFRTGTSREESFPALVVPAGLLKCSRAQNFSRGWFMSDGFLQYHHALAVCRPTFSGALVSDNANAYCTSGLQACPDCMYLTSGCCCLQSSCNSNLFKPQF